ncbi:MAG: AAA family ATPase [Chloroflexota bacterium]
MKIYHLSVKNFRGIRELEWTVNGSVNCLIGPGDSTKSTILDAIEYVLSPRWNISFADTDFFAGEIYNPIEIIITVGQLPDKLINIDKFGNHIRGWSVMNGIHDEPEDEDEPVISICLQVGDSLEPSWRVITERNPDGVLISARDRESLGMTRLGPYIDNHLSWSHGSALSRLTGDLEDISTILADAGRKARESVTSANLDKLKDAAQQAQEAAQKLGVKPRDIYQPALDAKLSIGGSSTLTLHDGNIPARQAGLGSRRLLALAIQYSSVKTGAILLIDEIEQGLEPHRLRHVLRAFRPSVPTDPSSHQIFMTTHSNISIVELQANELYVVRSENGYTTVDQVDDSLQGTMRDIPEALLGRKVIVCEGKTEYGICRSLDRVWAVELSKEPWACLGVVPITSSSGSGSKSPRLAQELANLGYQVAFVCDSDVAITPSEEHLQADGVKIIQWADNLSVEQRVCRDLPFPALNEVVSLAIECIESNNRQSILDTIGSRLGLETGQLVGEVDVWLSQGFSEEQIRAAIGGAAKDKGWFKRVDKGEKFGIFISQHLIEIPVTDLANKLGELRGWVYA